MEKGGQLVHPDDPEAGAYEPSMHPRHCVSLPAHPLNHPGLQGWQAPLFQKYPAAQPTRQTCAPNPAFDSIKSMPLVGGGGHPVQTWMLTLHEGGDGM